MHTLVRTALPRLLAYSLLLLSVQTLSACQPTVQEAYTNQIQLKQAPFVHQVHSEGELVPVEKTTLQVPRRLWGTLEYLAPEGTTVKKGDVVARVSTRQFTEQVSRYANNMADSRTEMRVRQMQIPLETLKMRSTLAEQRHAATLKKLSEQEVRQGPRENERVAVQVEAEKARLQAEAVPLAAQEKLAKQGYISETEVDSTRQQLLQQETLAKQAELKHIQQSLSYRQPEVNKAALETRAAELQTQITRLENDAKASLLRTQQLSSKGRSASLNRRVRNIEDRMNNAEMTAPFAGTLIYPRISGVMAPFTGMEVYNGMPIVQVAQTHQLQVLTRIHEFDIPAIKAGQKATILAPGIPQHPLNGTVSKVHKLARFKDENKPVGLKYFDVEITLDDDKLPSGFKAQMQVEVSIEAQKQTQAWLIPQEYLVSEKEQHYLWQWQQGKAVKVPVKIGPRNANEVVITGNWQGTEHFVLPAEATP